MWSHDSLCQGGCSMNTQGTGCAKTGFPERRNISNVSISALVYKQTWQEASGHFLILCVAEVSVPQSCPDIPTRTYRKGLLLTVQPHDPNLLAC